MEHSGAGGKLIQKNQKQKISWHFPFKIQVSIWFLQIKKLPLYF